MYRREYRMTLHNFNQLVIMDSPKLLVQVEPLDYSEHYLSELLFCEHNDLYDLLLQEPVALKKASVHYDYTPTPTSYSETHSEIHLEHECTPPGQDSTKKSTSQRKCTCSKSQCQKNYCQCFRLGLPCTSECECHSCCNKEKLFARKSSEQKVKCNCQKSKCMKNYCECHANGSKCGPSCKCTECENIQLLEDCL